ncbi:BON domain-containing protein [Granulicella arctica]|uniref:BON domain-containing protein n=1 Tax=Granulicella arctica TaxID=940613 RepID=UPI0021DFA74E|nr:BON domain-containing protein [Granulicella arctica]
MRQSNYKGMSRTGLAIASIVLLSSPIYAQTNVPDAQIEANVLKSLAGAPQLANENIITNTIGGTVTLSGTVKDEPTRQMAENLASRASGVKKVVDELTLGAGDPGQGTQGVLQSDGTMAPAPGAHAPDPDTYAAQHGITATNDQASGQSAPPDDSAITGQPGGGQPSSTQPGYRQPYDAQNGASPQQYPQGQQQYPQNQQPYPQGQQPYPQGRPPYAQQGQPPYPQGGYRGQPGNAPPPYGAQVAGRPVTVPPGSLLRIRINEGLDSKHTAPGTPFDAVVLNDVIADGEVAIPRGASVQGVVTESKSGGVIKGHGEIALQLNQVMLGGKTFPITSDIWSRDSSDKSGQTIGSAVGLGAFGALIGAVAGGGPGAAIGAAAGAGAGIGSSAASGSRQVLVPSEAILTFRLTAPAPMVTISQAEMDRLSYGVPTGAQQSMQRRQPPYYGPGYYPRPYPY